MKFKLIVLSALLVCSLGFNTAQAGIPVVSAAELAAAGQQLLAWKEQYAQMKGQFEELQNLESELKSIQASQSGDRGYADLFNSDEVQALLPPDWAEAIETVKDNAGYRAARAKYPQSENEEINTMYDKAAEQDVTSEYFFTRASKRLDQVSKLREEVSRANDPAAKADLRNRMLAEQLNITATANLVAIMSEKQERNRRISGELRTRLFICTEFKGASC